MILLLIVGVILLFVFPVGVLSVFGIGLLLALVVGVYGLLEPMLPVLVAAGLLLIVAAFLFNPAMWSLGNAAVLITVLLVYGLPLRLWFIERRQERQRRGEVAQTA